MRAAPKGFCLVGSCSSKARTPWNQQLRVALIGRAVDPGSGKSVHRGDTVATWRTRMARTASTTPVDLTTAHELTAGRIERLTCPPGKCQAFLRDTKAPALRVRVTRSGFKAFIFEAKLRGKSIRLTIGDVRAWSIEQ